MITLHEGDCRDVLATLDADSMHVCVCDPPYELSFMGHAWDRTGVAFQADTWRAVWRVLKPGGYLVAFGGTRTFHRMACAIEDAGFEIRDTLCWLYGSGFPKGYNVALGIDKQLAGVGPRGQGFNVVGKNVRLNQNRELRSDHTDYQPYSSVTSEAAAWTGWGTALKPAFEPIMLARKPLIGTVAANVLTHGTGAINIEATRVGTEAVSTHSRGSNGAFPKRPGEKSAEESGRIQDQRSGLDYSERSGRWPANVLHDGSDEVEAAFAAFGNAPGQQRYVGPEHETKRNVNVYGDYGPRNSFNPRSDTGTASRFFYCAKADSDDRADSKHPTVKPVSLIRWLVRLVCPPNGTILDPFAGSGTTGEAAMLEGFNAILIEREAQHVADIRHRIKRWSGEDMPLFAEESRSANGPPQAACEVSGGNFTDGTGTIE